MAGVGRGGDLIVMMDLATVGIVEVDGLGEENEGTADDEDGAKHGYRWCKGDIKRAAEVVSS